MGRENFTLRLTVVDKDKQETPVYVMVGHIVVIKPAPAGACLLLSYGESVIVKESPAMILQLASKSGVIYELK